MYRENITIRPLESYSEMSLCIALQREVWASAELEIVPENVFVVAAHTGGQVLAAFHSETPVGFLLSLPAFRGALRYLHSHMLAVRPDYQNQGVGRQLKLAQRDDALARHIDLIEWTFDPLQLKNAHFNLTRLGAVARRYLPDMYGRTSSPLHSGLPTDRLVAEWWLRSSHVRSRLNGKLYAEATHCERISVPPGIHELSRSHPQEAEQIQSRLRADFEKSFARGYTAVGFELNQERANYLMGVL